MRKPLIAGNWKMYKTAQETTEFFTKFLPSIQASDQVGIVVCPPFLSVPAAVTATNNTRVEIGGQNLFWEKEGAYTGEVSAGMLRAAGCQWAIIAHSERRQYFGETDDSARRKTCSAIAAGLKPIVCIGEHLEDREGGRTEAVLDQQIKEGLCPLTSEQFAEVTVAYEPVWAIGTGRTATPQIAAEAHGFIRKQIEAQFGRDMAEGCNILYGGSVKPDNIVQLMAEQDIDGALVGGASLDPASFASIVNYQGDKK